MIVNTSKVSIIILNWNKIDYTRKCVLSIEQKTTYPNYEIILFDNGSTEPETKEVLSNLKHKAVMNADNLGFAKGNNRAAGYAEGDLLLFLNNDTIVHKNWLEAMVKTMEQYPACGVVGSKLLYPDGTIQHIGVVFDFKGNRRHLFKTYPADIPEALETHECEAVTGACLLIRRDIFHKIGGFDEGYLHGSEDTDLCLKVRELGLKAFYCSESVVTHFEQISLKGMDKSFKKKTTKRNNKLFLKKWGDKLDDFRLSNDFTGLKPQHYYRHARSELIRLIPAKARTILDVGCGSGMLGKKFKEDHNEATVWGIELDRVMAKKAESNLDRVLVGDVEAPADLLEEDRRFDCIIFADLLEHLKDPWSVLRKFSRHLTPEGRIVCSIPNIQHYKIIRDIIIDRWLYREEGILDRDHLRFFTLTTIKNLFAVTGYKILTMERNTKASKLLKILNKLCCHKLDNYLTQQYLVVGRRRSDS